jgi:hypothetical protein
MEEEHVEVADALFTYEALVLQIELTRRTMGRLVKVLREQDSPPRNEIQALASAYRLLGNYHPPDPTCRTPPTNPTNQLTLFQEEPNP